MKRFIPLMITAVFGFLLIAAFFSPYTEGLGEGVAIWFDILAAIAFILGGGNLLKVHLKKISDRPAGWGYSVITVLAFLVTLFIGFSKWGVSPAPKQEEFGRTIAGLPLEEFTLVYTVEGRIPSRPDGKRLPPSVRWQMDQHRGKIRFRGWMSAHQKAELIDYKQQLKWQCAVEKLFEEAQPPGSLKDKVQYHADHEVLSFTGLMTEEDRDLLRELGQSEAWSRAVDELYEKTQTETQVALDFVPEGFDAERARQVSEHIRYDAAAKTLAVRGPMSRDQRDALARQFPVARPLSLQRCGLLLSELTDRGPLSDKQVAAFHRAVATWKVEQLHKALDRAGEAEEVERSYSAMLRDQEARIANIEAKELGEAEPPLTDRQVEILHQFVENREWTTGRLVREFEIAPLGPRQTRALEAFLQRQPTAGRRKYDLWHKLLKAGPLTGQQQDYLLADYRNQTLVGLRVRLQAAHGDDVRHAGVLRGLGGVSGLSGQEHRGHPAAGNRVYHPAGPHLCRRGGNRLAARLALRSADRKPHGDHYVRVQHGGNPRDLYRHCLGNRLHLVEGVARDRPLVFGVGRGVDDAEIL